MNLYDLVSRHKNPDVNFLTELDGKSISYFDFFKKVDCTAGTLLERVCPSEIVIIDAPKSIETIALAFACIKVGVGYCFIDPALPIERKKLIVGAVAPAAVYELEEGVYSLKFSCDSHKSSNRRFAGGIVFTSGSTGAPKGVLNSYEALAAYVDSMLDIMPVKLDLKWLSICPAHFDVFQLDFLVQSARGATIVIAPHNLLPQQYLQILNDQVVTEFLSISTLLKMFVDAAGSGRAPGVRKLYYGGEGCSVSVLEKTSLIFPNATFCQFYGPTENCNNTTFFNFEKPFSTKTGYMPLGSPVKNVVVSLRDENGQVSTPNQSGQIYISGKQILSGYLDVRTGEVVPQQNPFYASGDYGHMDSDGILWFEGRKDDIVKVNGNRVSLVEVSSEISKIVGETSTVATIVLERNGYASLIAGYASDLEFLGEHVREALSKVLPNHSLPKYLFSIDKSEVRLLSTGKTDFKHFKSLLENKFSNQGR